MPISYADIYLLITARHCFQLRAHMYQGRGLIGSDDSGLSDPFARVVFADQSLCTQVIDETLSPTWDEMLIFNEIVIFGSIDYIREFPPTVVIEIFDQDRMVCFNKPYFIQMKPLVSCLGDIIFYISSDDENVQILVVTHCIYFEENIYCLIHLGSILTKIIILYFWTNTSVLV